MQWDQNPGLRALALNPERAAPQLAQAGPPTWTGCRLSLEAALGWGLGLSHGPPGAPTPQAITEAPGPLILLSPKPTHPAWLRAGGPAALSLSPASHLLPRCCSGGAPSLTGTYTSPPP